MNKIIKLNSIKINRLKYRFVTKSTLLHDENGDQRLYFCIVLIELESKDIVSFTGYEKYVVDLSCAREIGESTCRLAMSRVTAFLNYILHHTSINSINEVTVNVIRDFLIFSRKKENGEEVKSDTWKRTKRDVFVFLENYYKYNHDAVEFCYTADELRNIIAIENQRGNRKCVVAEYKTFNVKTPKANDHKRRKRTIMYGHLDTLLHSARKHEPMIYLAISLMAYAGLREGEVVNLTFSDVKEIRILGELKKITLELYESDKFRKGKTHTGVIKKIRTQNVYPDFLEKVDEAIIFHRGYLRISGCAIEENAPLFYNKHKKPMSTKTLTSRIKNLFEKYFLEELKESSRNTKFSGETDAFINLYVEQYPGAHMFRHWYTMYLITKKKLRPEEVRYWRGDSPNSNAYEEYTHLNYDLIKAYKDTTYSFQASLLGDINE